MKADFAQLESDYQKLFQMVSRLAKRQSLSDYKTRAAAETAEPSDAALTKDDLRKKYLHNRSHADVARLILKG